MTRLYRVWCCCFVGGKRDLVARCYSTWLSRGTAELIADGLRKSGPAGSVIISSSDNIRLINNRFGI